MRTLIEFWTEIMHHRHNINKLATIGEHARLQLDAIIHNFDKMLELNPNSVPILRLYGILCLEILGDVAKAQELFNKADVVVQNKHRMMLETGYRSFLGLLDYELDIFDEDNGVVSISLQPETIGKVDTANPAFLRMLGYPNSKDVIGKNIKMFVPEPIRHHHDQLLHRFTTSRKSERINATSMVIGVHNSGHLVPFALYMRWADMSASLMIATTKPIINPHEVCFFVDPKRLRVLSATANFVSVFGFAKREVLAQRISLFDVLPELKDDEVAGHVNENVYEQLVSVFRSVLLSRLGSCCM